MEPRFNGVYSRDNLSEHSSTKIKDGACIINLDEYSDIRTYWVALYVQNNNVTYFDSFRVEHIPHLLIVIVTIIIIIIINTITNTFRIQAHDSIMCGYFCFGFIDFMLARKTLTGYTIFF